MDAPATPTAKGPTKRSASSQIDPRTIWLSAAVLVGALLLGVILVAVTYDPAPTTEAPPAAGAAPHIVPKPNSGQAPTDAGDPGGWAQLALLGLLVVTMVGIGFVMMRSRSRSAKAGREAWKAAAATGQDGAVDELTKRP